MRCLPTCRIARFGIGVIAAAWCLAAAPPALAKSGGGPSLISDSLYSAHHPRLLFTPAEIPALQTKVQDGGPDDTAYEFIRVVIDFIYRTSTFEELLDGDFGLAAIPNLGLGSVLESPPDAVARDLGRNLTVYIADNYAVDYDDYASSLRLRALSLGYDMFFENAPETQRAYIRDEIRSYIDLMVAGYEIWWFRPYLSNRSAMIAAALGLAAICLDGETDPLVVEEALERAEQLFANWLNYQVDPEGAYKEGTLYGAWSLRNLAYYFHARKRYDGLDHGQHPILRKMEKWFAYELLPEGGGKVNNIQDCTYYDLPLPRHTTYFDWAQHAWGSGLSAYIWEHVAGTYGSDYGLKSDKAGTVLWHQDIAPVQPDLVLPKSFLWQDRGLYYYRSGWPTQESSDDVLFSFFSGKFHGGHAQEDQNQFTLYAYGENFAIDHGPGSASKESEAHSIVLVDGRGQHNAGSSIGTDGDICEYVLNDFADYLVGDATSAYTTHSPFNNQGVPFPDSDWSWGYVGANPVNFARRKIVVVHDTATPTYFVIVDDIEKDGDTCAYDWRLHTRSDNIIDTQTNPIRISKSSSYLDIHVLNPPFDSLSTSVTFFNNMEADPDANVLSLSTMAINPEFAMILFPGSAAVIPPMVTMEDRGWGCVAHLVWSAGKTDVVIMNQSGGPVGASPGAAATNRQAASAVALETDASLAVLRFDGGQIESYLLANVSTLTLGGTELVRINNGTANVALSGSTINIDRYDADFVFYAPNVTDIFYRQQRIYFVNTEGTLTRDPVTSAGGGRPVSSGLRVSVYPNPFNPVTSVAIELAQTAHVSAVIYDALGRRVKHLWRGVMEEGVRTLRWAGRNDAGEPVVSGVYLLKVTSGNEERTRKLVMLK